MDASTSGQDMESVTVKMEPEIKLEPMDEADEPEIYTQSLIKIEEGPKIEEPEFPFTIKSDETSPVKENVVKFEFVDEVQLNNAELETDQICDSADPLDVQDSSAIELGATSKCCAANIDSISFAMVKCTELYHPEPVGNVGQVEEQLGKISFQCNRCNRNICTYERILTHYRQMHKLVFRCELCSLKIYTSQQLLQHVTDLGVVDVKSFLKKRFQSFFNADNEKLQQLKVQILKKCYVPTPKSHSTPASHSMLASHSKSFACLFCNLTTLTGKDMWTHLHRDHHYCSTCCVAFLSTQQFTIHKIHHESGTIKFFSCKKCEKKLRTENQMEQHWKLHHASQKGAQDSKIEYKRFSQCYMDYIRSGGFYCPYCFSFSQKESILQSHMQLHKVIDCSHCKCKFISNIRDKDSEYCTNCNMKGFSFQEEPIDTTSAPLDQLLKSGSEVGIPVNSYLGQILQAQMNIKHQGNSNTHKKDESTKKNQRNLKLINDPDEDQSANKKMRMQEDDEEDECFIEHDEPETSSSFVHTDESRAKLMSEIPKDCPLYTILKASMQSSKNAAD